MGKSKSQESLSVHMVEGLKYQNTMKSFISVCTYLYSYVNVHSDTEPSNYPKANTLSPKNLTCQLLSSKEVETRDLLIPVGSV